MAVPVDANGWSSLFTTAFRQSRNAMALVDEKRRHVDVNGAYLKLLSRRKDDLIGRPIWEIVVDSASQTAVKQKLTTGTVSREPYERTFLRKDGSLVPVMVEERLIYDAESRVSSWRAVWKSSFQLASK